MDARQELQPRKTIRTFAFASFLNDMGSDMLYPVWPLFVTTFLGANMAVLGLIDGMGDAVVALSQAVSGYYADKLRKRKIFIWTGYACATLSRLGYALTAVAHTWHMLIPFRVLDRAGKMRGAPRDAIIADVSTGANRGSNFGLLRTMDNFGAVAGIVVCIVLFRFFGTHALDRSSHFFRNFLIVAAIPSVISVVLVLVRIKEPSTARAKVYKGYSFRHITANFGLYLALNAVYSLGAFSYSFLLLYAKEAGFKLTDVPVLYLVFSVVATITSLPFGKLADRIGRKAVFLISLGAWAGTLLLFLFPLQWATTSMVLCFVLYGVHRGAIEPVQRTIVAELAPDEYRASALGAFQMVVGVCALPASLGAGLLWESFGKGVPLVVALILTVIAAVMLVFVKENRH